MAYQLVLCEARSLTDEHDGPLPNSNDDRSRLNALVAGPLINELLGKECLARFRALAKIIVELFEKDSLVLPGGE